MASIVSLSLIIWSMLYSLEAQSYAIINGSTFNAGSSTNRYANQVLTCNDNSDCAVACSSTNACYNATILCPVNGACSVSCTGGSSCYFTDIHWIQGNTNTLSISPTVAYYVKHPPSTTENTALLVNCEANYDCFGRLITCPDNAQCQILCSGDYSCKEAVIQCPSTSTCNIFCSGSNACDLTVVHWSFDPLAVPSLACPYGGDQCNLIQEPSIIDPPNDNDTYNLICNGQKQCASAIINCPLYGHCLINCVSPASNLVSGSCSGSIINCPSNQPCQIICAGQYSCFYATINGPKGSVLSILCDQSHACESLTVHAEEVEYFYFNIPRDVAYTVAQNTTIYYPPRSEEKNQTKATVYLASTSSFNGFDRRRSQQFYALNGWKDINIIYSVPDWVSQGGIMHCYNNYTKSCLFAQDSYSCSSDNKICDDPFITTLPPTRIPTNDPSRSPSTDPSISPTFEPTITINDTRAPTEMTSNPTSSHPTQVPTAVPTYDPTSATPTGYPTKDPTSMTTTVITAVPSLADCECINEASSPSVTTVESLLSGL